MRSKLVSVSAILGLTLGIVACEKVKSGPAGGLDKMAGIPVEGRIINVTRGDGDIHGVWIEAPDGTLSLTWANAANGDVYAKPQTFARK
jgi:hypothetical protein